MAHAPCSCNLRKHAPCCNARVSPPRKTHNSHLPHPQTAPAQETLPGAGPARHLPPTLHWSACPCQECRHPGRPPSFAASSWLACARWRQRQRLVPHPQSPSSRRLPSRPQPPSLLQPLPRQLPCCLAPCPGAHHSSASAGCWGCLCCCQWLQVQLPPCLRRQTCVAELPRTAALAGCEPAAQQAADAAMPRLQGAGKLRAGFLQQSTWHMFR